MKTINTYINEKLHLTAKYQYTCQPKDKYELREIILQRIKAEGPTCDLNDIDTSKIKDMSYLVYAYNNDLLKNFNGDVSLWNVSNVTNMNKIFYNCEKFNCDISSWDVSKVETMTYAFKNCPTCPKWYDKDKWETI